MTGTIWLCDLLRTPELIRPYWTARKGEPDPWIKEKIPGQPMTRPFFRLNSGQRLPLEELPKKLIKARREDEYVGDKMHNLPPAFSQSNAYVDESIAHIMRQFDIYEHALHPVDLYLNDEVTRVDKLYYLLNFGVQKRTIDKERSETVRRVFPDHGWFAVTTSLHKEKIYSLPEAHKGPDLWVDPQFIDLFFVSDRLGASLKKAKFARALAMYPLLPPVTETIEALNGVTA